MKSDSEKTKRVSIIPPKLTPSRSRMKLRQDNYRLIRRLEHLEMGRFGIKRWFNSN